MKRLYLLALVCAGAVLAQQGNQPDRLEWFRDQGFGLFIHWSVDSQIGSVISHSLVGASDDYVRRFYTELPKTFNPRRFHPEDWAALAKLAGVRYVVFTAKHHSGFAMWNTETTAFGISHTPFHADIVGATLRAFKDQGSHLAFTSRRMISIGCTRTELRLCAAGRPTLRNTRDCWRWTRPNCGNC
jgi:alpha-L-fucosidase